MNTDTEHEITATIGPKEIETIKALDEQLKGELPAVQRARCADCDVTVDYRPTPSGNGFVVVSARGADAGESFGVGDEGRPICPDCGDEMAPVELAPAADAITQAAEQLHPQARELPFPFNYAAAMDSITDKNLDVQRLRDKHDVLKKQAANAKKDLDEAEPARTIAKRGKTKR